VSSAWPRSVCSANQSLESSLYHLLEYLFLLLFFF
jgi:hypothetical protein